MKVCFTGATDDQVKWGGCDDPRKLLVEGQICEVEHQDVHSFHTKLKLWGIEGWFNSVSFEEVTEFVSKSAEVLSAVPKEDRDFVALDAQAYLNMVGGMRPSDAARSSVRAYKDGILTRETFCSARLNSSCYPNYKCSCGKHKEGK